MSDPVLSIVVIGRNEGPRLGACMASIRRMSAPGGPVELIYVDSASGDGSPQYATESGAKVIYLNSGKLSAARARNAGWQAAAAPVILFLDGDTVLDPDFVIRVLREFNNPAVAVVCGHRREIHPEASLFNRVLDLDWVYETGIADFCGGDALMRRAALERAGGFNPDLIAGEEPDLCRRIRAEGGLILRVDAPMTGHDLAIRTWGQYWQRAVRTGHAYAEVSSIYKHTADPLWSKASRRNLIQGSLYTVAPAAAFVAALLERSWIPVLCLLLAGGAVVWRTALRAKRKPASFETRLLFAMHSHVQQIPILAGQIRQWMAARRHFESTLIEYKSR